MRNKAIRHYKFVIIAIFLIGWAIIIPIANAANSIETRKAIQANYNRMNAAISKKDLNTFFSYFAPNYVSVDTTGRKTSKAENRQILEQLYAHVQQLTIASTVEHVVQGRSVAKVTVKSVMIMLLLNPRTHQLVKGVGTTEYLDEWIEQNNHTWLLKTNSVIANSKTISLARTHYPFYTDLSR